MSELLTRLHTLTSRYCASMNCCLISIRFRLKLVAMHGNGVLIRVTYTVAEIDEQLRETALCCCVIAQHGAECCIAEGLGEALAEGFASAGVVGEAVMQVSQDFSRVWRGGDTYRRKHRTTCLSRRTVCCSTS